MYDHKVIASDSLDRAGKLVAVAVFVALIVDGVDLQMLALSLPSISKELRLSGVGAGALSTYTLLGMGIGGVLAGWLSDRVGRVRVVWWSAFTFSTFTGVIALCQTYWQIGVMRFISGFGLGALYSIGTLLAAEYVPPTPSRSRQTVKLDTTDEKTRPPVKTLIEPEGVAFGQRLPQPGSASDPLRY